MRYVFDIETDGFFDVCTKIHCLVLKDVDTNKFLSLSVDEALDKLSKAKEIIGHNIIKFDLPVIKKLYPTFKTEAKIFDTLVATRLLFPDVKEITSRAPFGLSVSITFCLLRLTVFISSSLTLTLLFSLALSPFIINRLYLLSRVKILLSQRYIVRKLRTKPLPVMHYP